MAPKNDEHTPLYLPTCPNCGYVVSKDQPEPKRCPGCGNEVAFGTSYIQDKADFPNPGNEAMVAPHTADAGEEVKRGTRS